jgi:hypothetical protein
MTGTAMTGTATTATTVVIEIGIGTATETETAIIIEGALLKDVRDAVIPVVLLEAGTVLPQEKSLIGRPMHLPPRLTRMVTLGLGNVSTCVKSRLIEQRL